MVKRNIKDNKLKTLITVGSKAIELGSVINSIRKANKLRDVRDSIKNIIVQYLPTNKIELKEMFKNKYTLLRTMNLGSSGTVSLIQDNDTLKNYTIKRIIINNSKIQELYINNEIDILKKLKKLGCKYTTCYVKHVYHKDSVYIIQTNKYENVLINTYKTIDDKNMKYKIILNMVKGLKQIHRDDITHNDIKLENILVNKDGDIRYIEFGIGCYKTCNIPYGGTKIYNSPEMLSKVLSNNTVPLTLESSKKSDIWSLGVVMYEILYNKHPYINEDSSGIIHVDMNKILSEIYNNPDFIKYDDNVVEPRINRILRQMFSVRNFERPELKEVIKTIEIFTKQKRWFDYF